jgi:uncharacterized protein YigE (DUF2233 family)
MTRFLAAFLAFFAAAGAWSKAPCETRGFEGGRFTVCAYDPNTDKIAMAWRTPDGARLLGFSGLKAMLGPGAERVRFAVNAGMFHEDGAPVGLFVANGARETSLNLKKGPGNFHMLPNGVFWIDHAGRTRVETGGRFAERNAKPVLAAQSGPMVLIAGKLHPRFQNDGPSRLIRNGVGAAPDGGAIFVISETPVSFGKFARFFRDEMRVRDALYLDGSVSSLWEPGRNRMDVRAPLGPLIWVY